MRLLVLGSCALFLSLPAMGQTELKTDLLSHASDSQVASHLWTLVEKTHEPSGYAINIFTQDLHRLLGARTLRDAEAVAIVTEINAIFKSAGTSTVGYLEHIAKFKAAVIAVGVVKPDAEKAGTDLEAIGRQVRGPEDTPVNRVPAQRLR